MSSLTNTAEDIETRRRCLEAASIFNTERVVEFIRWAYNSAEIELQCSSIYAMGRTGESSWLELLFREMKSPNPPIRYEAANACAEIEEEEAIVHLIPLTEDEDLQVQLASIRAIGTIGGPLAKKALRRCIKSGDPVIESTAIDYLEIVDATDDLMVFRSYRD